MSPPDLDPILSLIIGAHAIKGSTVIVGVTGGVAVGKSTFSNAIATLLSEDTGLDVAVIASDGFLYPNSVLAEQGLSDRKGFPDSYDVAAIAAFLAEVRAGKPSSVPVYDHHTYDIIDEVVEVGRVDVLIFEGVNALQFHDAFDVSIYLHADEPIMREWFIQRTIKFRDAARIEYSPFFDPWINVPDELFLEMANGAWDLVNLPNLVDHIEPTRP
ncbi:MAG: type I pantothenate kinase, partial [Acidimicrobiia bacterium]|nr:type I pantothenate kinase [Acidimicrobiia bacterium]